MPEIDSHRAAPSTGKSDGDFSGGGHNNAEEASDEFSIFGNS